MVLSNNIAGKPIHPTVWTWLVMQRQRPCWRIWMAHSWALWGLRSPSLSLNGMVILEGVSVITVFPKSCSLFQITAASQWTRSPHTKVDIHPIIILSQWRKHVREHSYRSSKQKRYFIWTADLDFFSVLFLALIPLVFFMMIVVFILAC